MVDEDSLIGFIAGGGRLSAPDNVTPRYRGELMRLMAIFVDSEMAGASGFADCINLAPGLKERIIATHIVLEKFDHARQVLGLMEQFGANTAQYVGAHPWASRLDRSVHLGTRRMDGDMRLNVFHYPINGWVDAVVMNCLMGQATVVQLDELTRGSYQPLADTLAVILPVERRHAELGEKGLQAALERGHDRTDAQASVNYWYPRVADTFGSSSSDHFAQHRKYGLRQKGREELLARWQEIVHPVLTRFGLSVPTLASSSVPGQAPRM
ncbi:Phenylacetic acid catabolic protein [Microvirga arsenatis]|uniref:Phenylacetic acid catabolic n=1 Tax=Microvirga arsenatis TaxID=2692265 RepID=A0ABW9YZ40_9HYPH|nr:Phenylacetic acid catabolic protein [Microvirga arsenatis]NBJ11060.1 phenylacetic acid catabolic [Microvirga arsenatis]NBJ25333.1 phenylacetic acid catabolic [Microvirga arsenatis]